MNSVNTLCNTDVNQKKSKGFSKLPYVLALCTMLNIANPTEIKADNVTNNNLSSVEVVMSDCDIIGKIEKKTGVVLPNSYSQKFRFFVSNSKILKDKDARNYTENFVVKQMQSNRGITKQNQLLFIWDAIYEQITSNNIYTGEDGNDNRLAEFENVMDKVELCGKNYNSGFKAYMRQKSTDADKRSADADKRSADADKRSADADKRSTDADKRSADADKRSADADKRSADADKRSADADKRSADADKRSADADKRSADADKKGIEATYGGLDNLVIFYYNYKKNPSNVKQEEIQQAKALAKRIVNNCKYYKIDYKAKLSPEIRKFYGID